MGKARTASSYRAFRHDFVACMSLVPSFPEYEPVRKHFQKHRGGIRLDSIAAAYKGDFVPENAIHGIIDYILSSPDEACPRAKRALDQYLTARGIPPLDRHVETVVSWTCTPPTAERPGDYRGDPMIAGFENSLPEFLSALDPHRLISRDLRSIEKDPKWIADVVRWIYIHVGRDRKGPTLDHKDAIAEAGRIIGASPEGYTRHVQEWVKTNHWTVLLALGAKTGTPVGVTIVLPLDSGAYEQLRTGKTGILDHSPIGIDKRSNDLFVEACAPSPSPALDPDDNAAVQMAKCLLAQAAALARTGTPSGGKAHRWLSRSGTKESHARLLGTGYAPTGTSWNDMAIVERVLDGGAPDSLSFNLGLIIQRLFSHIRTALRNRPPS